MSYALAEAFAKVEDPRSPLGRRHPLTAMLIQATVAMLAGAKSLEAIAQFGRDRGEAFATAVGFSRPDPPCKVTFHNLFKALDAEAFERELAAWAQARGWSASLSIDGKRLRGSAQGELPGVHLLSAFTHQARTAVAQMRVQATTNEHKAALELLDMLPLQGVTVTGDAAFCQRDLSEKVVEKGGTTSGRSSRTSRNSTRRSPRRSRRSRGRPAPTMSVG